MTCGVFDVPEDRKRAGGRRISLGFVVLPATGSPRSADPVFFIAGGPGQTVTEMARAMEFSPLRIDRDVVLLDQRGTGEAPRLDCADNSSDDPQAALAPIFDVAAMTTCRVGLQRIADLTKYTTMDAVEDLEDFRKASGYDRINLVGASYGTRVILQYLRQAPASVRSAILTSPAPISFRNPLHHARSAQDAIDTLFAVCAAGEWCGGDSRTPAVDLATILSRLATQPATVEVTDPRSGARGTVVLDRDAFAEALRVMMYSSTTAASIPALLRGAADGDYTSFANQGIASNRNLRAGLRLGMLMSVVCSEDVPRIHEAEIAAETRGTFLGESRVRQQIAACGVWPKATVPAGYGEEVVSDIPSLVISGRFDPVTPPQWGERTRSGLTDSRHIVVNGGHSPASACLTGLMVEFLRTTNANALSTTCS